MFTNAVLVAPAKLQVSALKRLVSDEEAAQEEALLQGPPRPRLPKQFGAQISAL